MTDAEYPSLTSGTITPIVKLRLARSERAKKLGRYLNFLAAAWIRSLVSWGIESATLERFITRETVAGDSPRYSASSFRLTGLLLWLTFSRVLASGPSFFTLRSLAQTISRSKSGWRSPRNQRENESALAVPRKNITIAKIATSLLPYTAAHACSRIYRSRQGRNRGAPPS